MNLEGLVRVAETKTCPRKIPVILIFFSIPNYSPEGKILTVPSKMKNGLAVPLSMLWTCHLLRPNLIYVLKYNPPK